MTAPTVSFILATHNRAEVAAQTIQHIHACGLPRRDYEIIAVDNASCDNTAQRIKPNVDQLIPLPDNRGSCAKAYAVDFARAQFIVFLDDDSYPQPASISAMIDHFAREPRLGCAGFHVHLPNGRQESSALPNVFVGCGVGLRADALRQVGGLDPTFFMQAEEYDLAFRLANAGWFVRRFDNLHVTHLKTPTARKSTRTTYFDVRNNLIVAARHLPAPAYRAYFRDWLQRYRWLANLDGHLPAYRKGKALGAVNAALARLTHATRRLRPDVFEDFFRWNQVHASMHALRRQGVQRILLAGLGKNIFAFLRGAILAGLKVSAVIDDRFAGQRYRSLPVISHADRLNFPTDAVVVSDMSPVHAFDIYQRLRASTDTPVVSWYHQTQPAIEVKSLATPDHPTDERHAALVCT